MPTEIQMPRLSDTMSEGTISKWRKQVGETVNKGDILVEIETDKANMELEAFQAGVLGKVIVPEGETVEIGVPIAIMLAPGEQLPADGGSPPPAKSAAPAAAPAAAPEKAPVATTSIAPPAPPAPAAPAAATPAPAPAAAPAAVAPGERQRVSPLARKIAEERGVDLRQLAGTGPSGRIVRADVEGYLQRGPAAPQTAAAGVPGLVEEDELAPLSTMQQTIVRRMLDSKAAAPHFYVTVEIDMTEAVALRKSVNEALPEGQVLTFNDLIIKAAGIALQRFPQVNISYKDNQFVRHAAINIGIAVAIEDGLLVPVLRNTDQKSLAQISREAKELIDKARRRHASLAELEGSTFTITNLGMFDVDQFTAIINQPNSAILAIGAIVKKPVVKNDQIVIGDRMRVTLSADHRAIYGAHAAEFLREFKRILERPMLLVL